MTKEKLSRGSGTKSYEMGAISDGSDGSNRVRIMSTSKGATKIASTSSEENILQESNRGRDDWVVKDTRDSEDVEAEAGIRKTTKFEISRAGTAV